MSDVPASNGGLPQRDQLSDHEYDGIQEFDNPTPGWWIMLFVATVIFAVLYFVYYHSAVPNRSVYDRYGDAQAANMKKKLAALGITDLTVTEPNMLQWMVNPDYLAYGKGVFKQNCVQCHGSDGQGLVGPNLTDDAYKNINKLTDIPRVISTGAANGAMPAWSRLGTVDVALVGAYVARLRGQNLPGPRGAEGDKIPPWPPLPAASRPATSAGK
jgi:cytochrome c oxidase cbb3-type subunit III